MAALILAVALAGALAPGAAAKPSYNGSAAAGGISLDGSPYRYLAISPGNPDRLTVVERIERRGGEVSRWWYLPGGYYLTAPAYDSVGAGLSADERTLVLTRLDPQRPGARQRTKLAILDTAVHLRLPGVRRRHAISYLELKGDYSFYAISPHGSTVYLTEVVSSPPGDPRFVLRALDTGTGRLLPRFSIAGNGEILSGTAIAREPDATGRRVYTLYRERGGRISVLALDTVGNRLARFVLPQLRGRRNPMLLTLRLDQAEHELTVSSRSGVGWNQSLKAVARIDLRGFAAPASPPRSRWDARPFAVGLLREKIAESSAGRPIEMTRLGDLRIPEKLLIFGCVHGDECAARGLEPLSNGCPDPDSNIVVVPDLDPDGSALGTRLNARGVDLNRNFPAAWRPIGAPGDLQYSGPRPFSEPESRLAARIIRGVRPRVTVWFHQFRGAHPFVRAWGQSAPTGRRLARLAGISFQLMPWQDGTAPNWQNHRFPGTASLVVELPPGPLDAGLKRSLEGALIALARETAEV